MWLRGRFEPGRDYALVLEAQANDASAAAPARVSIDVNGIEVGEVVSTEAAPRLEAYRFTVPASVLSRSPDAVIRSSADASPDAGGDAGDSRLAVKALALRPAR